MQGEKKIQRKRKTWGQCVLTDGREQAADTILSKKQMLKKRVDNSV